MTPAEVLARAADVIEERGWNRFGYVPDDADESNCPVCVLAAINVAAGRAPTAGFFSSGTMALAQQAAEVLADYLGMPEQARTLGVVDAIGEHWNDHLAGTETQVVTTLRAAAAEYAGAGQ